MCDNQRKKDNTIATTSVYRSNEIRPWILPSQQSDDAVIPTKCQRSGTRAKQRQIKNPSHWLPFAISMKHPLFLPPKNQVSQRAYCEMQCNPTQRFKTKGESEPAILDNYPTRSAPPAPGNCSPTCKRAKGESSHVCLLKRSHPPTLPWWPDRKAFRAVTHAPKRINK